MAKAHSFNAGEDDPYEIRHYRHGPSDDDFRAIDRLNKSCVQGAGLTFYFGTDKEGSICRLENPVILVAEHRETKALVGTISASCRRVRFGTVLVDGREQPRFENVSHLSSIRVDPQHRRHGLASRLIKELECILATEKHVAFVDLSISSANEVSMNLFENKFGYERIGTGCWPELDVKYRAAQASQNQPAEIEVNKMSEEESRLFLKKHCQNAFLFPEDVETVTGNVFIARDGDEFVALRLNRFRSLISFLTVSRWQSVKRFFRHVAHYVLPGYIEPPLELGRLQAFVGAHPFVISTQSGETTSRLFTIVLNAICKDLAASGFADILFVPITLVSNISGGPENAEVIKQCLGGGAHMEIDHYYGKSLKRDHEEATEIMRIARENAANFWFMDGREL